MNINFQKILGCMSLVVAFNLIVPPLLPMFKIMADEITPVSYTVENITNEEQELPPSYPTNLVADQTNNEETPASYPTETPVVQDVRVEILSVSLGLVNNMVCGLNNPVLEVTIEDWKSNYTLQGRSFTNGEDFSDWTNLIGLTNSQFVVHPTDANYRLTLINLPEGDAGWDVRVMNENGEVISYSQTSPIYFSVTNDSESQVCTGEVESMSISGHKYEDVNDNTLPDSDIDTPISDWQIDLYKLNNDSYNWEFITQTTTNENGVYAFNEVEEGTYYVCETIQSEDWTQVYPNENTLGSIFNYGSNFLENNEGIYCHIVNVTSDKLDYTNYDFVNIQPKFIIVLKDVHAKMDNKEYDYVLEDQYYDNTEFSIQLEVNQELIQYSIQKIADIKADIENQTYPLYAVYAVSGKNNYSIVENPTEGYDQKGCYTLSFDEETNEIIKENSTNFSFTEGQDYITVACINQVKNLIPNVNISSIPSTTVISPDVITLTANATSGDGVLNYLWTCSTGETGSSKNIILSSIGSRTCTVTVSDIDGDNSSATGVFTINQPITSTQTENPGSNNSGMGNGVVITTNNTTPQPSINEGTSTTSKDDVLGVDNALQVCDSKSNVSGYVFIDSTVNNSKDASEVGISNVNLTILTQITDKDGNAKNEEVTVVKTNTLGRWETSLCPGTYTIRLNTSNLPENTNLGEDDHFEFTVVKDQNKENVNFAAYQSQNNQTTNWWLFLIPLVLLVLAAGGYAIYSTNQNRKNA